MSYNLLADELAHGHRNELYRNTSIDHLLWPRRWALIKDEIEHYLPDVVCLQEVDHWVQVRDELQALGYEGQYLQRSGGRPDGCATLWRGTTFELVAVNRLNFQQFDLRDNVGLMAVLKHTAGAAGASSSRRGAASTSSSRHRLGRSRSGPRRGSSSESSSSSDSESDSNDGDRTIPVPRVTLRAAEEAAAQSSERVHRRRQAGSSRHSPSGRKHRGRRKSLTAALAAAAAAGEDPGPSVQFLAVANTHVLFNPKRGDIKLAQLRLLIHHLQNLIAAAVPEEHVGSVAAMIMGDFNSIPDAPLYRFVRDGWIDCLQHHRKDIAGNMSTPPYQQRLSYQGYGRTLPHHQQAQMLQYGTGQQGYQQQQQQQQGLAMQQGRWPASQPNLQLQAQLQQNTALQGMMAQQQQQQGQMMQQDQALQHVLQQQQQQPQQHPQQQQGDQGRRGLPRSASAPVLTLRVLKRAGWTAEELITATGGVYNTHLRHFLQQHQQEQQQQLLLRQQQEAGWDSGEEMDLASDDGGGRRRPGFAPSWGQQQQQQQQRQGGGDGGQQHSAAGYVLARDLGVVDDSGEEMDLELPDEGHNRQQQPGTAAAGVRPAGAMHGQQVMQQQGLREVPPPPPPPSSRSSSHGGAGGPQQQQQQALSEGPQAGAGRGQGQHSGRNRSSSHSRGQSAPSAPQQQQLGRQGPGQGRGKQAQLDSGDQWELEDVPFFLKHAPAHRMDEPLPPSVGDGIARHEMNLRSCYAEVVGAEPEFTSCHDAFWGTVDFIWYTPEEGRSLLQPVSVLLPPAPETHLSHRRCLPNATIPSDHISLVADFMLSTAGQQPARR